MSKTTQSTARVTTPEATDRPGIAPDAQMTDKTAAELRTLCEELGEEFDMALTEAQARDRIAALQGGV